MSDKDKIEITELVLQMGPTKVSMSLKDAEEVFKVLKKIFGRKVEKEYVPYYPYYRPYRWYYEPYYGTITCNSKLNDNSVVQPFNVNGTNVETETFQWNVGKNLKVENSALCLSLPNTSASVVA